MGLDFTEGNAGFSLEDIARRNRGYIEDVRNGVMVERERDDGQEDAKRAEERPEPPLTPVSGTDVSETSDAGKTVQTAPAKPSASDAKPKRGRRRGPARETHAITVPAELWQEWVEMAERNDTNVSFMIEDVMRRKGRKLYG